MYATKGDFQFLDSEVLQCIVVVVPMLFECSKFFLIHVGISRVSYAIRSLRMRLHLSISLSKFYFTKNQQSKNLVHGLTIF